mmetsp:Transcript_121973/g.304366  ORF Transcript_121973/g.304366 Transcript_121973/m.304366 type:complete len:212 (+) Transcript_121973:1541-2176(+)
MHHDGEVVRQSGVCVNFVIHNQHALDFKQDEGANHAQQHEVQQWDELEISLARPEVAHGQPMRPDPERRAQVGRRLAELDVRREVTGTIRVDRGLGGRVCTLTLRVRPDEAMPVDVCHRGVVAVVPGRTAGRGKAPRSARPLARTLDRIVVGRSLHVDAEHVRRIPSLAGRAVVVSGRERAFEAVDAIIGPYALARVLWGVGRTPSGPLPS